MISPEILKQSATAGFMGLAVAGTVFAVAVATDGPSDATVDVGQWTDPVQVSYDEDADEVEKVERRADTASSDQEARPAKRATGRARNRAARRALEELQSIECRTVDAAEFQAEQVRIHINHAARDVAEQPSAFDLH